LSKCRKDCIFRNKNHLAHEECPCHCHKSVDKWGTKRKYVQPRTQPKEVNFSELPPQEQDRIVKLAILFHRIATAKPDYSCHGMGQD